MISVVLIWKNIPNATENMAEVIIMVMPMPKSAAECDFYSYAEPPCFVKPSDIYFNFLPQ